MPWRDARIDTVLGRGRAHAVPTKLISLIGYLFSTGCLPQVSYITYDHLWQAESEQRLRERVSSMVSVAPAEQAAFDAFFEQHARCDDTTKRWELDFATRACWGYVEWSVAD